MLHLFIAYPGILLDVAVSMERITNGSLCFVWYDAFAELVFNIYSTLLSDNGLQIQTKKKKTSLLFFPNY